MRPNSKNPNKKIDNSLKGETTCLPQNGKVCDANGVCQGGFVGLVEDIPTSQDCLVACQLRPGCNWYSFLGDLETCVLNSDCASVDGQPNSVHGRRDCELSGTSEFGGTSLNLFLGLA